MLTCRCMHSGLTTAGKYGHDILWTVFAIQLIASVAFFGASFRVGTLLRVQPLTITADSLRSGQEPLVLPHHRFHHYLCQHFLLLHGN